MVGAELDLVAFFRGGCGNCHDAGVIHEDVEAGGGGIEGVCGDLTDWSDARSSWRKVMLALGISFFMETIAASAFGGVRAAR